MNVAPFYLEWPTFGVFFIAGKSSSGKSSTARFLLSQMAIANVGLIVADGHGSMGPESLATAVQPLERSFLLPPARDKESIYNAIRFVNKIKQARVDGVDKKRTKIALVIDEFTSFLLRCEPKEKAFIADLMLSLTNEARKTEIRIFVIAHNWSQDYLGAAAIRRSISGGIFHRLDDGETKLLRAAYNPQLRKQIASLKPGQAVLDIPTLDPTLVTVPYVSLDDLLSVQALVTDKSQEAEFYSQFNNTTVDTTMNIDTIIRLLQSSKQAGKGKVSTIYDIWGVKPGSNVKYTAASKLYDELIKRGLV
jgi:hypothetical protein